MTIPPVIDEAVRRLVQEARPSRIVLFGSHARADTTDESDLDFLVIMPKVENQRAEMVRLWGVLSGLGMPIDVLVFSEAQVKQWGDVRGTVLYPALREGIVLYDAAWPRCAFPG